MSRLAVVAACYLALFTVRTCAQEVRTVEHQNVARSYLLENRSVTADGPKATIIFLHGRRDPAQANSTDPRLDTLAGREALVAVYPAAITGKSELYDRGRNAQPCRHRNRRRRWISLRKLIHDLISAKIANPARVYISGTSQGGFLAYSALCDLSEKLAAVAVGLASMTEPQISACKPQRAVPMLVIAGTNDRIVPYDGWLLPGERLTSIPETLEFWRRIHHCTGQKAAFMAHRLNTDPTRLC